MYLLFPHAVYKSRAFSRFCTLSVLCTSILEHNSKKGSFDSSWPPTPSKPCHSAPAPLNHPSGLPCSMLSNSGVPRGVGLFKPPSPKFGRPSKTVPNPIVKTVKNC